MMLIIFILSLLYTTTTTIISIINLFGGDISIPFFNTGTSFIIFLIMLISFENMSLKIKCRDIERYIDGLVASKILGIDSNNLETFTINPIVKTIHSKIKIPTVEFKTDKGNIVLEIRTETILKNIQKAIINNLPSVDVDDNTYIAFRQNTEKLHKIGKIIINRNCEEYTLDEEELEKFYKIFLPFI